jgi:hypothetical protein
LDQILISQAVIYVTFIAADKRFKDDQALTRADAAVDALDRSSVNSWCCQRKPLEAGKAISWPCLLAKHSPFRNGIIKWSRKWSCS